MKLLKSTFKNIEYSYICLENEQDVLIYKTLNEQIKSRQAVNFWMTFKSQSFRNTPMNYAVHEANDNPMAYIMATKMEMANKEVSIFDYCFSADKIIFDMHNIMLRYVIDGSKIKINDKGGYCPIDSIDEYEFKQDINEQELHNFLLGKDINFKLEINSDTIVIENDNYIPKELIEKYAKKYNVDKNKLQIITSFKLKTILYKIVDFKSFFIKGIEKYDLKNIVLETTAQDGRQISNLKEVLQSVMFKFPNKTLNIYIKTYSDKKLFTTDIKNINIIFI